MNENRPFPDLDWPLLGYDALEPERIQHQSAAWYGVTAFVTIVCSCCAMALIRPAPLGNSGHSRQAGVNSDSR